LVHTGKIPLQKAIALMTLQPAKIMGLPEGRLEKGGAADITIIDPNFEWTVDPDKFYSKSRNTPFAGKKLKGRAVLTMLDGRVVHNEIQKKGL
jgi:dihydroorotase